MDVVYAMIAFSVEAELKERRKKCVQQDHSTFSDSGKEME